MSRRWPSLSGLGHLLAGLVLTGGAVLALVQHSVGAVREADLTLAGGPLAAVTPCSTGRHARFNYRVDTPKGPLEASLACPSSLQQELAARVGQTVMAKYRQERDLFFTPRLQVYELRVDNGALWSVQETVAQRQAWLWLAQPLALLGALAGAALVLLGLRSLLRMQWQSR